MLVHAQEQDKQMTRVSIQQEGHASTHTDGCDKDIMIAPGISQQPLRSQQRRPPQPERKMQWVQEA